MFKSPLEASTQSFEQTAIFVENIFDTVKKAKAAKAAAKSLAESKLMTSYDYSSFGELSPVKKKKPRKNAKKSAKVKPTTPKKKTTVLRKPKTPKDSPEKRKKVSPAKSPRKYTKRVPKAPATNDIDDEEAAFILSSISQRSFDSFYNRLNSCEPNKFHIELSPTYTNGSPSTVTDPVKNLAYYVMLDHNYWVVEPEVQPVKEPEKVEPIKVEAIPTTPTSLVTSLVTPIFTSPAKAPEIAQKAEPEVKVDYTTQASVIRYEASTHNELHVESKLSPDLKSSAILNHVPPCAISNEIVAKTVESKRDDVKPMEVNNNKFPSSPEIDSPKQETFKSESTSVKKRWLRQAASDMKAPVKKRKTAFFEAIDAAAEENHSESKLTNGFCANEFSNEPMKNGIDKPRDLVKQEECLQKPVEEVQKVAEKVPKVEEPVRDLIEPVHDTVPVLKSIEQVQKTIEVQKLAKPLQKPKEMAKKVTKRALKLAEPAKKSAVRGKKVQKAIEFEEDEAPVRSKRANVKLNNVTSPVEEIVVQKPAADVASKPPLEQVPVKLELEEALMPKEEEKAIVGEAKAANCIEGKEEATKACLETGKTSVKVDEEDKIIASIDESIKSAAVKTEPPHEIFKTESAAENEVDTKGHVTLAHRSEQVELKPKTASPVTVQSDLNGCAPESTDDEDDSKQWEIVMDFHRLQLKQLELNNKKFTDAQSKSLQLCDTNGRTQNSNHYDPLMPSLDAGRLPLISSRFGLFQQDRIPQPAEDPRKPFRSSLSLEANQFAPNITPSPFQRSISETSITKRNRWSNNTAATATPFNSHSAMPFGSYYNENHQIKRDEPFVSSYNTYRSQKNSWINNKGVAESSTTWEPQKEFAPIAYRTESFLTSYAGISDKPSLLSTIKADEQISAIQKKTLTKTNIPLIKPKPSACDPRLNPSLQQDARKEDLATPKKKLSLDQYRKRVSLTSITSPTPSDEPPVSQSPAFDPIAAALIAAD